jgi:hypothetical protein
MGDLAAGRARRVAARVAASIRARGAWTWVLAGYLLLRLANFHPTATPGPDSEIYRSLAGLSLWDPDFYAGRYPWATPLLWKLLPGDHLPAIGQLLLSTIAWAVLATTTARLVRTGWLRWVAVVAVLGFSLVVQVTLWDGMLLSESLSMSLLALVLSAWLALARHVTWRSAIAVLALTLLWSFTRDSNAYAAVLTVPVIAVWLVGSSRRRVPAVVLAGTCAIFAASFALADRAERHALSLHHVLTLRLLEERPDAQAHFDRHGMPLPGNLAYFEWLGEDGDRVYLQYLLSHPGYTLSAPFRDTTTWLAPENFRIGIARSVLPSPVEQLLYPRGAFQLWFWFVLVGLAAVLVALRLGAPRTWVVPVAAGALAIPHGMIVWLGDAADVDRHAVQVAVEVRLALLLLAVLVADRLVAAIRSPAEARPGGPSGLAAARTSAGRGQ